MRLGLPVVWRKESISGASIIRKLAKDQVGMADWLMSLTRDHQVRGSVPLPGIVAGAVNLARVDPSHVREIG